MAYEIATLGVHGLGSPEDDPFARYDAAMAKSNRIFYWGLGCVALALVGFGAVIWAKTR